MNQVFSGLSATQTKASEAFWRVLESRGLVKRPKYGLEYLFSIAFGILVYFQKNEPNILPGNCI